jgi:hypothetical protein
MVLWLPTFQQSHRNMESIQQVADRNWDHNKLSGEWVNKKGESEINDLSHIYR